MLNQINISEQLFEVEAERLHGMPDYQAHDVIAEGRSMLRGLSVGSSNE